MCFILNLWIQLELVENQELLIEQAKGGNNRAFQNLFEAYQQPGLSHSKSQEQERPIISLLPGLPAKVASGLQYLSTQNTVISNPHLLQDIQQTVSCHHGRYRYRQPAPLLAADPKRSPTRHPALLACLSF